MRELMLCLMCVGGVAQIAPIWAQQQSPISETEQIYFRYVLTSLASPDKAFANSFANGLADRLGLTPTERSAIATHGAAFQNSLKDIDVRSKRIYLNKGTLSELDRRMLVSLREELKGAVNAAAFQLLKSLGTTSAFRIRAEANTKGVR